MRSILLSALLIFSLVGCASKKEKREVNEEISQTPTLKTESDLNTLEDEILMTNKNLTNQQRNQLSTLIKKTRSTNQSIQNEIMKTRAVLFRELVNESDSASRTKVRILENQLLKLNRKKTRNSLSAYKEAKSIVGKSDVPLEKTLMMIDNRTIRQEF